MSAEDKFVKTKDMSMKEGLEKVVVSVPARGLVAKIGLVAERGHGQGGRERDRKRRLRWLQLPVSSIPACLLCLDVMP